MRTLTRRLALPLALALAGPAVAAPPAPAPAKPKPLTRLFFQDRETQTLRWADLRSGKAAILDAAADVPGFPKLDPERQGLAQMEAAGGHLIVGVRDKEDGAFGSGWTLVATGVSQDAHGDHVHWKYAAPPSTRQTAIEAGWGKPAHLYQFDGVFYVSNDAKNGYVRVDPKGTGPAAAGFHAGGGGHVSLAVANGHGFASWIDAEGENAGRVDVTPIRAGGNGSVLRSFKLSAGALHGAAAAGGKVFFASADGIGWVDAAAAVSPGDIEAKVRHLSLGTDPETDKPRRTGAFAVHRDTVLFATGTGADAALGLIDAKAAAPKVVTVKLPGGAGTKPVAPEVVRTNRGKRFAFVFHDAAEAADEADASAPAETLTVVDLDPNGDGAFADAAVAKTTPVGKSAVEGHGGHHAVAFDADGRRAFVTNPGDGTIAVYMLATLDRVAEFRVGGTPTAIVAVGGWETGH